MRAVITSSTWPSIALAAAGHVTMVARPAPARMAPRATSCGAPTRPGSPADDDDVPRRCSCGPPGARGRIHCATSSRESSCAEAPT